MFFIGVFCRRASSVHLVVLCSPRSSRTRRDQRNGSSRQRLRTTSASGDGGGGRVVAPSTAAIEAAIEAQRTLLIEAARGGVKELRPLKDVSLAWSSSTDFTDKVQLGSFRCTKCGAFNVARAEACTNCGAPRGDEAPRGSLTMAMRTKALDAGSCGFMPFDRGDETC
jgi:hypothetical protein